VVDDVWPTTNAAGGPLLIVGRGLERVVSVSIGGRSAVIESADFSVADHEKLVTTVPTSSSAGTLELRLATAGALSRARGFAVSPSPLPNSISGPTSPYPLIAFTPDDDPDYPPISNFWRNECNEEDVYFLSTSDNDPEVEPNIADNLPANQVPFVSADGSPLEGYVDLATRLIHLRVGPSNARRSYIGVYSNTGLPQVYRMVLFPEATPGRQVVAYVCNAPSCEDLPLLDRSACTP
jgi:hypothetical protein